MFLSESVLCRFRDITIHTVGDFPSPQKLQFLAKILILESNFAITKVLDLSIEVCTKRRTGVVDRYQGGG